jgi:hypothetical protein
MELDAVCLAVTGIVTAFSLVKAVGGRRVPREHLLSWPIIFIFWFMLFLVLAEAFFSEKMIARRRSEHGGMSSVKYSAGQASLLIRQAGLPIRQAGGGGHDA